MKNKGLVFAVLTVLLVGLLLSGCGGEGTKPDGKQSAGGDEDKVYTFNFATETPDGHPLSIAFSDSWVKAVEEATNGRVKFTMHYGGSLVEGGSMLQGVSSGIADAGWCPFAYFPGEMPLYNALAICGFDWLNAKIACYVNRDFIAAHPEGTPDEIVIMYVHSPAPGCLVTNKPIATLEDIKGMQFRVDPLQSDGIAALGATPVAMTMPEAYEALSKNVIDGVLCNTEPLIGWNLYEITDYILETPFMYSSAPAVIFNKEKWNSLPADLQDIIKEVNEKHFEEVSSVFDDIYVEGMEFGLQNGMKASQLTEEEYARWKEKLQVSKDNYAKLLNDKGYQGDAIIQEIEQLVEKYIAEFAGYTADWRARIDAVIAQNQ